MDNRKVIHQPHPKIIGMPCIALSFTWHVKSGYQVLLTTWHLKPKTGLSGYMGTLFFAVASTILLL